MIDPPFKVGDLAKIWDWDIEPENYIPIPVRITAIRSGGIIEFELLDAGDFPRYNAIERASYLDRPDGDGHL